MGKDGIGGLLLFAGCVLLDFFEDPISRMLGVIL
jgi:hypothetical protein